MSVFQELHNIQIKLNAKKDKYNDFGKYPYRTAEGILAEVKPLLQTCIVLVEDHIELIGDRYYCVSTATITNGTESFKASSQAREDLELKGMNGGQISGAVSSYAKKYALANLFAIDGVEKDLDAINETPKEEKKVEKKSERIQLVEKIIKGSKLTMIDICKASNYYYKESDINKITKEQFDNLVEKLNAKLHPVEDYSYNQVDFSKSE